MAQISLCKVQHSLISSLHCVLGITAGICLGRESGGERESMHMSRHRNNTRVQHIAVHLEAAASFPLESNQFHPKHHMHVLLKLRGEKKATKVQAHTS